MTSTSSRDIVRVQLLAQHVELQQAGWWDEAIKRAIKYALFTRPDGHALKALRRDVQSLLGANASGQMVINCLESLASGQEVVDRDGKYYLTESSRRELSESQGRARASQQHCASKYEQLAASPSYSGIVGLPPWDLFEEDLLLPLIQELGARTISMLSGEISFTEIPASMAFLGKFDDQCRQDVRDMIADFLDPADEQVRGFVLGHLNHYMLIAAGGLDSKTLQLLSGERREKPRFRIILDTNIVFSMLDLHVNPHNEAAQALLEVARTVAPYVDIGFLVLDETLLEARRALEGARYNAAAVGTEAAKAIQAVGFDVSGLVGRFYAERANTGKPVAPDTYFGDYISGLDLMLEEMNVTIAAEQSDDIKSTKRYVDLLSDWTSYERQGQGGRSRDSLEHDIYAFCYVENHRRSGRDRVADAEWWLLTADEKLQRFERRRTQGNRGVPKCISPAELIQILRFWVPRTSELEAALLGGIRLPFAFYEYDPEAERITHRILSRLESLTASDQLSQSVIEHILTDRGLRSVFARSDASDAELDRSVEMTLVDELKQAEERQARTETELVETKERLRVLESATTKRESVAAGKERSKRDLTARIEVLERELAKSKEREVGLREDRRRLEEDYGSKLMDVEATRAESEASLQRRIHRIGALVFWIVSLGIVVGVGLLWWMVLAPRLTDEWIIWVGIIVSALAILAISTGIGSLLGVDESTRTGRLLRKATHGLWGWLGAGVVGAAVAAVMLGSD